MSNSDVEVLLCTYNGEPYLAEFLASLSAQTFRDFQLVVRDDCSSDETLRVIKDSSDQFLNPPHIVENSTPSGSAMANFSNILSARSPAYAFLADQDDIWKSDKISRSLARMKELEAQHGVETPILLHGDLEVIDGSGKFCHRSFWEYKKIDPSYGRHVATALMHPSVVGCTALLNRSLLEKLGPIPPDAVMHDWWINLLAATFGKVDYLEDPLVSYRIHGGNASKPRQVNLGYVVSSLNRSIDQGRRWMNVRMRQGKAFHLAYGSSAPAAAKELLERFATLDEAGQLEKRIRLLKGGYFNPGLSRKLAALFFV